MWFVYFVFFQLMCCAVESNGWHLYRSTQWFKNFGAHDDDQLTYEGGDLNFLTLSFSSLAY